MASVNFSFASDIVSISALRRNSLAHILFSVIYWIWCGRDIIRTFRTNEFRSFHIMGKYVSTEHIRTISIQMRNEKMAYATYYRNIFWTESKLWEITIALRWMRWIVLPPRTKNVSEEFRLLLADSRLSNCANFGSSLKMKTQDFSSENGIESILFYTVHNTYFHLHFCHGTFEFIPCITSASNVDIRCSDRWTLEIYSAVHVMGSWSIEYVFTHIEQAYEWISHRHKKEMLFYSIASEYFSSSDVHSKRIIIHRK